MSKVWFITGASRGIGLELAKAVVEAGDRVIATGRKLESVVRALGESENVLPLALDVSDEKQAILSIKAGSEHFGRIDVVVNNAGFAVLGALEEVSDVEVRRQFDTNVFGLLNVTRAALPVLRNQGSGHIINLSSLSGFHGDAGASSYCATKFAVEGITECLALEVARLGINVTVVEPGFFRTDFLNSNSVKYAEKVIDAYAETAGATRTATVDVNGKQANDPKKLAAALVMLANQKHPPLRFTAGADAVELFEQEIAKRNESLQQWRHVSVTLQHD
ncbi:SDR family NAD(P)-dependent oxidoreductase [Paraburkholderia sp. BCC1884]|uniref:SDR family NAD(P)-dependent oxidoreductase n=1 Tax=Paraburkholderia sp. BCC1884 TaxID=2562668 RepID=UPI001182A8B1|nr:SDR family NAD(P)-dependent oxidoreductase [Paraburkholderia sp. BCC1884]